MRFQKLYSLIFCLLLFGIQSHSQHLFFPEWDMIASHKLWSPTKHKKTQLLNNEKLNLILLLSTECPMCISYTRTIEDLYSTYATKINFYGIFPGRTYTDKKINEFVSSYKLSIPVLVDPKMKLTKVLKGEVTPEVFLFDAAGKCVYKGAIDNWLVELGKKKIKADQHYLKDAIDQTLRGESVLTTYTKAQGCLLNDY